MKKNFHIQVFIFSLLTLIINTGARPGIYDYKMQCIYIYKFTQLVQWPQPKNTQQLIIGVAGISPLVPELEQYIAGKNRTSNIKINVVRFSSPTKVMDCDLLYITKEEIKNMDIYVARMQGKPTLLVTELPGFIKRGACINPMYEEGSSIKVQLNRAAMEAHKLKITLELIKLSNEVF